MGKYITKQRRILLDYLNNHKDEPLTVSKIASELSESGVSESSVYRNLAELEKSGELKPVNQGENNQTVYRYSSGHGSCKTSIHLFCENCGKMFHLKNETENDLKEKLTAGNDFHIDCSKTVLYGVCGNCKKVNL